MNKNMVIKTLTAFIMIVCVLPPLYFGGIALHILMAIITALSAYEIACLLDQKKHLFQTVLNFVAIVLMYECKDNYVFAIIGLWLIILFTIELFNKKVNSNFVAYTALISILLCIAFRTVLHFYDYAGFYRQLFSFQNGDTVNTSAAVHLGFLLMLYVAFGAFLTDTGAYFCGITFGKHKMLPRISPNKTWEGAIGGYFFGAILSCLYGILVLKVLPISWVIVTSLCMPIVSQIGDLAFSSIKRHYGIKDFGNEFPGHGGILDRVDSLIFVLLLVKITMSIWGL